MTDNIPSYVREGVKQRWLENSASPPDQLSVELPGYYSKIRIPSDQDILVQYPGDVVYLNNLVQYSVLLGYQLPETAEIDKWGQFLEKL
ncbi:hypothetical protein GQ600_18214 [Phytophthora cactorum]|nr:hypothetical protein GQ600_18214 [Phytophthora cactorum]